MLKYDKKKNFFLTRKKISTKLKRHKIRQVENYQEIKKKSLYYSTKKGFSFYSLFAKKNRKTFKKKKVIKFNECVFKKKKTNQKTIEHKIR